MPVRSINLKLIVPRGVTGVDLRQSLWDTHAAVNAATRYYEERLLPLRGLLYELRADDTSQNERRQVPQAEVERQALALAREAQRANLARAGSANASLGSDQDVLTALQRLYAHIAPDETGEASAQAANAFLSPLCDPRSKGFGAAADKLDRPRPNWLTMADDDPQLLDAANAWFASDASRDWRSDTGSPPAWVRAAREGKPEWPQHFREKLKALATASAEGPEAAVLRLRELYLLPLFKPYFPPRMAGSSEGVTPWDRLAFRLAVSHLLSWQAWVRRAAEQHEARREMLRAFRARVVTPEVEVLIEHVRGYEAARSEALSGLGLGPARYTLHRRQLRGWDDLRQAWRKSSSMPEALRAIAADHQTRKRGRFGDPDVFRWLAEPEQHRLWRDKVDVAGIAATLNGLQALIDRSHETAMMTLPEPRLHPRAVQWSAEGDTNLRPYRLRPAANGTLEAELCLLRRRGDDKLEDVRQIFRLAPSTQFHPSQFGHRGKKAEIAFTNGAREQFTATLGSADLLLDRDHLSRRDPAQVAGGDIGPVWLKLALDLDRALPEGWKTDHARFTRHFAAALGKTTKAEETVHAGARVLAVDLGVRTFAACSVFRLFDQQPAGMGSFAFPLHVSAAPMWAIHERSSRLDLPGEAPSREGEAWRREQREAMRRVRRAFGVYRRIMRLTGVTAERSAALAALEEAIREGELYPFLDRLHAGLVAQAEAPQPVWDGAVAAALSAFRREMGPVIHAWRRSGRERQSFRYLGKSMWAIEHLTNVRRTLQSWSLLGRASGEVRRLDRAGRGIFAAGLLAHLDHIKGDRLKTGADLIVRAALGFVRDKAGRWEQRFPPCDAVLFEDLSRYRMRTDRPRRENSQLMRWAHRSIPLEVEMQGAIYGLAVVATGAAFSSRYHARSQTPGLRCRVLAATDLADPGLADRLGEAGIDLTACRPGDLVPEEGGEVFVCLRRDGGLVRIDADINAAQNLQRRFWTRHAEAIRLPCVPTRLGDTPIWAPRQPGKRLLGALGGPGALRPTGHESGSCRWEPLRPRQSPFRKEGEWPR
ncbi:MAG TPA: type V CRISPR-associated protein Cas12b [Stellaceae bacterium]|nr:type V CRISPR-associated protein Cas12b [Stellaceae bacterium]